MLPLGSLNNFSTYTLRPFWAQGVQVYPDSFARVSLYVLRKWRTPTTELYISAPLVGRDDPARRKTGAPHVGAGIARRKMHRYPAAKRAANDRPYGKNTPQPL